MSACPRTGCEGEIDEDGFCDACGLEAPAAASASTRTGRGSARTTTAWTSPSSAASARTGRGSTRSSRRGQLGKGVVEIPEMPRRDPRDAVLSDPQVPEDKRFCSNCGAKVGRGRDGGPGRAEGFCPKCGHRFSLTPKLTKGEWIHGQYEVLGCLAHGGLGWIYLAVDHAVSGRTVVLKGLLDTGDADAMAAALAERQFLAHMEHPAIVRIYNFVEHAGTGYIVMEYVGGASLKDLLKTLRQQGDPAACLPIGQAIAYTLEMLLALGYLHEMGLVYCDFKPDNAIRVGDQLKLIDLGAVRQATDSDSAIYGTIGYQAPEVGKELPSAVTDLYTVGRALAVMTFPFDFHSTFRESLPTPADIPLLAEHESFYRLLVRATHRDPAKRFGSAEEMREQLEGVFREVAAAEDDQPRPGLSTEFLPERRSFGVPSAPKLTEVAMALPVPRMDVSDPGAVFLGGLTATDPAAQVRELTAAPVHSPEVELRLARAHLELEDVASAEKCVAKAEKNDDDWRIDWHRGLIALVAGKPDDARRAFDSVYDRLPGAAAPKLAIAACAEAAGDTAAADRYYRQVWRTDRSYLSAAFGLYRTLLADGERGEAVDVLESVPETSNHYITAQLAAIRSRTGIPRKSGLSEKDLVLAGGRLARLDLDEGKRANAARELLESALGWTLAGRAGGASDGAVSGSERGTGTVLGHRLAEPELRRGLEECYLTLAKFAATRSDRVSLVDKANQVRPRTWF